ncbi:MAG: hypothetical protein P3X24_009815 [bacterium]|nr:hypothetical protein [bacterium]
MNDVGYPRGAVVLLSVVLTLLTGALATPQILNGVMVYSNPEVMRDGQYWWVFWFWGTAGLSAAIPAAVVAGVLVKREGGFVLVWFRILLVCLVLGMGVGMLLATLGAGLNGLGWAVVGIPLSGLAIPLFPLTIFLLSDLLQEIALVGGVLLAAVLGAYGYYRRVRRIPHPLS